MKTLNEQIERLRELVRKCYGVVATKNGTLPDISDRTIENLPAAIESTHDMVEELTITQNGEYLPSDGVAGFSKVTAKFDTSSLPKVKLASSFKVTNACINANGRWGGESMIDTSECTSFYRAFDGLSNLLYADCSGFDTSKVTNMMQMFNRCDNLRELDLSTWDVSSVTNFYYFSHILGDSLKKIDMSNWDVRSATNVSGFLILYGLESIIGDRTLEDVINNNIAALKNLKVSLAINQTKLDRASLRAVINGLADLTGQTAQTLTLGATLLAKLTEEDIAIATSKNWTIA